jgi:ornithine cyclodeaminase/alanine dehydrogenase
MRLLTRADLESVLTMGETIAVVEDAFAEYARGNVSMPLRIAVNMPEYDNGMHGVMHGYVGGEVDALAIKAARLGGGGKVWVFLFNPEDGSIRSLMDGGSITAMRTAAVCGVAAKYLARSDAEVLGLFGAGTQGRTHVAAINEVRPLSLVKVFDLVPGKAAEFAKEVSAKLGIEVVEADDPKSAVTGSDMISVTASTKAPVFEGKWLEKGMHVTSIGSHGPQVQEIDSDTVARAKVVVDSKDAIMAEGGDILIPISEGVISEDHIYAELGDLVTGAKPGRTSDDEITLYKSVGLALQDVAAAERAYRLAEEKGVGTLVEF